jgi:hypothetical protein
VPPFDFTSSRLWRQLEQVPRFSTAITNIRDVAEALANKAEHILPEFTDHSVVHMDALWSVTEKVLSDTESARLTPGELFVLGASFYIHDLGMCVSATKEGRALLMETGAFKAAFAHQRDSCGLPELPATECAIRIASRELHATLAESLANDTVPGLDRHLFESREIRRQWAVMIGEVAASHHWSLRTLDQRLGARGVLPAPEGCEGTIDLGYVACILRVVDFAHINSSRARLLDRLLRSTISPDSLRHWKAQEHINGPTREDSLLVFASAMPIDDVDGWWTFYDMVRGLESEIHLVHEYLAARSVSQDRFSLRGVKGASSPSDFAAYVQTKDFEPIDVRFHPESMERLITLLGGRTLYGNDSFAPLRELLQNAADAIALRQADELAATGKCAQGNIDVAIDRDGEDVLLKVTDDGVGMTERVITKYLLGIASDYWKSSDFHADHPGALQRSFKPVGRFGIGFLSVFMLGNEVRVETSRRLGGDTLYLTLRGIGRRGALERMQPRLVHGTSVATVVKAEVAEEYVNIHRVVQARAPMVEADITIREAGSETVLAARWWQKVTQDAFIKYVSGYREGSRVAEDAYTQRYRREMFPDLNEVNNPQVWRGKQPETIADRHRIIALPHSGRIIMCCRGFKITKADVRGFVGIVDDPDLVLDASRRATLGWDEEGFRESLRRELRPRIESALASLQEEVNVPARFPFLVALGQAYGAELLKTTSLKWLTVLERPGTTLMIAPADFIRLLRDARELVIGYNVHPWSLVSFARDHCPNVSQVALYVPISATAQGEVRGWEDYRDRQEIRRGALAEHTRFDGGGELDRFIFLNICLELIGEAWEKGVDELRNATWISKDKDMCVHLLR